MKIPLRIHMKCLCCKYLMHANIWTSILLFCTVVQLKSQHDGPISSIWDFTESRQFDFWVGTWDVNLRMIQDDLTWADRVRSEAKIYRILDGKAILEFWNSNAIKGYSLRHFDRDKKKWVLYLNWPGNNRSGTSSMEGSFRHGRGEFFATRQNPDGQEVLSRFTFSDIAPSSLRWDDAFSQDGGKSWTHNWIMEFSRKEPAPVWPRLHQTAHTYEKGETCTKEEFKVFEPITGRWEGQLTLLDSNNNSSQVPANLEGWQVLDGCAVMHMLTYALGDGSIYKSFSMKTFNTYANVFEDTRLDNQKGTPVRLHYGSKTGEEITLVESDSNMSKSSHEKYIWKLTDSETIDLLIWESRDGKATWQKKLMGTLHKRKG